MRQSRLLAFLTSLAIATPFASAAIYDTISDSMSQVFNLLGALFTISIIEQYQEGFFKFLIFILILRVVTDVLSRDGGKPFNKKTAGIIGFVVAATTVWFTPNDGLFAAIIALLVPLCLIGYLTYWGVMKLKGNWLKNLMGAVVLLLTIFVTQFAINMFQGWQSFGNPAINEFIITILTLIVAILSVLFFVKLMQCIGGEGGVFNWRRGRGDRDGSGDDDYYDSGRRGRGGSGDDDYGDGSGRGGAGDRDSGDRTGGDGTGGGRRGDGGLDWDNPGSLQVRVKDIDRAGVPGAKIVVRGPGGVVVKDKTDVHGWWPSERTAQPMGSGVVEIKASKGIGRSASATVPIEAGDTPTRVELSLGRRGTPAEGFEPHIDSVRYDEHRMVTEAHIDDR